MRHQPALDVLGRELVKLRGVDDAFVVEAIATYLFDILNARGDDDAFRSFCQQAVEDPRSGTSELGLQAMSLIAALGHPAVRPAARAVLADAGPGLELPGWSACLGQVHVVEAASLATADGNETVLHVLLDYDEPGAGSRHLLTVAAEHTEERVHLLDVRGREPGDTLGPMAERYAGSQEPIWSWIAATDIAALVATAVRTTAGRPAASWPVVDVDGGPTSAWTLGVARLEGLSGIDLGAGS
jgi:hypothetical protein